jgi:site-specific recombinase XerD
MQAQGIPPLEVTADHVRLYKRALAEAGMTSATVARRLSVLRGAYEQLAAKRLIAWETAQDIAAVKATGVQKNSTPSLTQRQAVALLEAIPSDTLQGIRDLAMMSVFFLTGCRVSAVVGACVGHLETDGVEHYLHVTEKRNKKRRKILLDAVRPVLAYVQRAGIKDDKEGPLFRPLTPDATRLIRRHLDRKTPWRLVKKYCRAAGIDPDRLSDLVQVTNPPGGWMQNCNCSPAAMMRDSPMVPEKYRAHPYLFNVGRVATHQRAQMMNALLAAADQVTVPQAIDIAFNPQVYRAESWQARVKEAWSGARDAAQAVDAAEVVRQITGWNRRSDPDSTGALAYYAFKQALGKELGAQVGPPAGLKDGQVLEALRRAAQWLRSSFGAIEVPYGRYFRVGREGTERTWPLGGGSLRDQGMATPRAVSFGPSPDGKTMIGHGGQTSTQVIVLTDPPQSYAVIPLGESDHKDSGHWDDQAEKLFSRGQAAPTYFLNRAALLEHVTSTKVLHPELTRQAAR